MGNFASGKHAFGECRRCGFRYKLSALRADGNVQGLMVCKECWEPKHPQERILPLTDPQALRKPAPELSIEDDYGEAAPTLQSFLPPP